MNVSSKIIKVLTEMALDHEKKPEDYTNASNKFDDIFLDGDYYTSDSGIRFVYKIYDETNHQINLPNKVEHGFWAISKDGYNWKIVEKNKDRNTPIDEKQGEPIDIAKYLADIN